MDTDNKNEQPKSFLSNKAYDTLKVIAAILPILGAFYFGLAEIWGLPYGGAVQATFALLASTLSAILIKLSYDYKKLSTAQVAIDNEPVVEEEEVEENTEEETINE